MIDSVTPESNGPGPVSSGAAGNYRTLVENSLVGVAIVQDEKIVYVNGRASELVDCEASELLGACVYDKIHPRDTKRIQQYHVLRQLGRKVPKHYDIRLIIRDGSVRYLEVQSMDILYGERPALLVNMVDVSQRVLYAEALKQSEQRYRLLFENNPDIVLAIEREFVVKANAAARTILGYSPEELQGARPWDICPEMQPGGFSSEELFRIHVANVKKNESQSFEWLCQNKNGDLIDCELSLVWCGSSDSQYVQAIFRDISERKRAEERHRALETHLETQKRQFYKNTILSFTDGKLDVVEKPEIAVYIADARLTAPIDKAFDLQQIRLLIEDYLTESGLDQERLSVFLIGIGEAMTNALVHAESGLLHCGVTGKYVWVAIEDEGYGIDSLLLPKATIGKGFSTKSSMGFGFTLMLEVADKVLLSTGPSGTTVVLLKST